MAWNWFLVKGRALGEETQKAGGSRVLDRFGSKVGMRAMSEVQNV